MKLKRRSWSERNHKALNGLLSGVRPGEIAVFDWDNTCVFNDIGEALLRHLTFGLAYRIDARAMAAMVPDRINGVGHVLIKGKPFQLERLKKAVFSAYGRLKQASSSAGIPRRDEEYRVFTSGLLALNRALEETPGIGCEFAYPWVIALLQGLSPAELDEMAATVIARALKEPIRRHALLDPAGRWRYDWSGGVRLYPEMKDLAACWRERGGKVVVSTASHRQLVEKMIAMTGFPCRQVIGMELEASGGRFRDAMKPGLRPNLGWGKVANLRSRFDREPALAAGDSSNDVQMLTAFPSTRVRLVIDRHKKGEIAHVARRARAGEIGFLVQEIDPRRGIFQAAGDRG